jgi:hypothetical protein
MLPNIQEKLTEISTTINKQKILRRLLAVLVLIHSSATRTAYQMEVIRRNGNLKHSRIAGLSEQEKSR